MNKDQLVEGPFGSNACYEQSFIHENKEVKTWLCFGSGFTTSTLMVKNSPAVKSAVETSPELYKDLMHIDKTGKVWFPATITLPEKGMVFVDGKTTKDWKWSSVSAIKLTEEELSSGKFPKGQEWKMDMANAKLYGQKDFMDALETIGFYD